MSLVKNIRQALTVLAASTVLVPSLIFLGGLWLAGPYEGKGGILGMLTHIFKDAVTGSPSALLLLFGPLLLILIWQLAFATRRIIIHRQTADNTTQGQ